MNTKALLLATFLPCAALAAPAPNAVSVTGNVAVPTTFDMAALRALPATHVAADPLGGHGPVALDCTGPLISILIDKAGSSFGDKKNASLAHVLLVTGDDGYAVALSFGEIDPQYGHAAAIVATDCNGKPEDSPRLVVPGDIHAGRAVRGVASIEVR